MQCRLIHGCEFFCSYTARTHGHMDRTHRRIRRYGMAGSGWIHRCRCVPRESVCWAAATPLAAVMRHLRAGPYAMYPMSHVHAVDGMHTRYVQGYASAMPCGSHGVRLHSPAHPSAGHRTRQHCHWPPTFSISSASMIRPPTC